VNFDVAMGRIKSLAIRFQEVQQLFKKYDDILQGQANKGVIEKVTKNMKEGERKHYRIRTNIGEELKLANWQIATQSPNLNFSNMFFL